MGEKFKMPKYDFSGWATRNDLLCSDGRTIRKNAFKHNDGQTVPLVWNHQHNEPDNVLGHALLKNKEDGVYAYCSFNDTETGKAAKELVKHGDVRSLSIYANQLKQSGSDVLHGMIREVSLVLSGANPGAFIDSVISHSSNEETGLIINYDESLTLYHSDSDDDDDSDEETIEDVFNTLTDKQKNVVYALIGEALSEEEEKNMTHSDDLTLEEILDTLDEEQEDIIFEFLSMISDNQEALDSFKNGDFDFSLIPEADDDFIEDFGEVLESLTEEQETAFYVAITFLIEHGGEVDMKHNLFDNDDMYNDESVLSHSEMTSIIADAKRYGSMKDSVLAHGIEHIDYLFPDAQQIGDNPLFIQRDMTWVSKVFNNTHKTPFSRIKSIFANITEDEARAKGYIKGKMKKDEVFSLLKRSTDPTTVYKKQKLERDDVIDIIDFDVVTWLKAEMRMMLDEEIARAILVGDGRLSSSDDKINENNIRPIWKDDELYTIKQKIEAPHDATEPVKAKAFIRAVIKSRKNYKGSGQPTLFTTEDVLTECLLLEDKDGRIIYDNVEKLATVLRVKEIVTVPVMENLERIDAKNDNKKCSLMGIIVNLQDYNVGADKGGAVNMFDDFDIDYNAQKYLIETRCSGALVKPYSAIAIEHTTVA
nr:MAG TPA: major capsid protein [Caudoviricetes sp.]